MDAAVADTGMDLGSAIDSAFTELNAAEETSSPEVPAEPTAPENPEVPENPATPETNPAEPSAPSTKDAETGYELTPAGDYVVPKAELPAYREARAYAEEVQQMLPTAADARAAYESAGEFNQILTDYRFGTEQDVDHLLNYLAGGNAVDPNARQSMQLGFQRLAERLPAVLSKVSPDAYSRFVHSAAQPHLQSLYDKAAQTGSEDDLLAAQSLDWALTGQYKTSLQRVDPNVQQHQQLQQERQQLEQMRSEQLDRDWQAFNQSSVDGDKWAQFNAEIDKVLAPVKDKYNESIFAALRSQVSNELINKIAADPVFANNHKMAQQAIRQSFSQAWKSRQRPDAVKQLVTPYIGEFLRRTRALLPTVAKPLLDAAATAPGAAAKPNPATAAKPQSVPQNTGNGVLPPRAANGQFVANDRISGPLSRNPEFESIFN